MNQDRNPYHHPPGRPAHGQQPAPRDRGHHQPQRAQRDMPEPHQQTPPRQPHHPQQQHSRQPHTPHQPQQPQPAAPPAQQHPGNYGHPPQPGGGQPQYQQYHNQPPPQQPQYDPRQQYGAPPNYAPQGQQPYQYQPGPPPQQPNALGGQQPANTHWNPRQQRYEQTYELPEEVKQLHAKSKEQYPELNLSEGEFVITKIYRHPIGIWSIWFGTAAIGLVTLVVIGFLLFSGFLGFSAALIALVIGLFVVGISAGGSYIGAYVYKKNKFIITNESIIQRLQKGLFSHREQTIALDNVRDASHFQNGILEHIVGYGNIRLSTISDETTYRFSYVQKPKDQVAKINNAVEHYKRGRSMLPLVENRTPVNDDQTPPPASYRVG